MSYTKIQSFIFDLEDKARRGHTCDEAARIIDPLVWYIKTDRCPIDILKALLATNSRQRTTIVKRLASSGSYDDAIASVKDYLYRCFPDFR